MQITMSALREWAASQGGDVHKVQYARILCHARSCCEQASLPMFGHLCIYCNTLACFRWCFESRFEHALNFGITLLAGCGGK